MNRRGFFGALLGGLAAATGIRRLVVLSRLHPSDRFSFDPGRAAFFDNAGVSRDRLVAIHRALPGRTDTLLHRVDEAIALPGEAPWRAPVRAKLDLLDANDAASEPLFGSAKVPVEPGAASADLPEVWPGLSAAITATASLPPLDQVETLVELFGASGDAAPSFAAALIGELVLTRMRVSTLSALHAPAHSLEGFPS